MEEERAHALEVEEEEKKETKESPEAQSRKALISFRTLEGTVAFSAICFLLLCYFLQYWICLV